MRPIEAWLKLCRVMKRNEIYNLKTYTILGYPSLQYHAQLNDYDELVFYGEPKMGGLKLQEPIKMGRKEFMDLFPVFFSKEKFSPKYSDVIPNAPFIFPLIEQFIIKEQEFLVSDEFFDDKPKVEDDNMSTDDDHLRSKNRKIGR